MGKGRGRAGNRVFRFLNRYKKEMIIVVGFVMVLSSFYTGVDREMTAPAENEDTANWVVVNYDSAVLGSQSTVVKVTGVTNEYKLWPNQMSRVDRKDITDVFESNVTGVRSIILEAGGGSEMFHIATDGGNVTDEIRKRIRLPGGYNLYRVYKGTSQYGSLDMVGENLEVGDYVNLLLLQRTRNNKNEVLGFSQRKVPVGPYINVTVIGDFDGYNFDAKTKANVTRDRLASVLNTTSFEMTTVNDTGSNGTALDIEFNMPQSADVNRIRSLLAGLGIDNVTVSRYGYIRAPPEMVVDDEPFQILNPEHVHSVMKYETKANDTISVRMYTITVANQTISFAREILSTDIEAQ